MDVLEKTERLGIARPFRLNNLDHCRNHFTGFFDHDGIADANIFALDLVFVVQRRARNCAAANENWLEHSYRRQNSGPPDLDFDIEQFGFDALRCVFVSNRPAR